jgi:uncharacterized membrane protein
MGRHMGIIISYCIGALCILLPIPAGKVLAEVIDFTTQKYGRAAEDQKKVRPFFSILVGVVIIVLTTIIKNNN